MASDMIDDPKLLACIQKTLVEMLEDMDKACHEFNISYSVYGRTMIDAIRHKGSIPQDDDIDALMTRRDYGRFLAEAPTLTGPKYRFDNTRTLPKYPCMFTKLGFTGTLLIPEFAKDANYRMPICLNVLPPGTVPTDPSGFKKQSQATWLWGRLLYLTGTPTPILIDTHDVKHLAIHMTASIAYHGVKLLRVTPCRLQKLFDAAARGYEGESTGHYADFSVRDPKNWVVNLDEIQPTMDVPFDGVTVQIAPAYDAMMHRTYDEYVELPPVEQRRNHKPVEIDFGPLKDLLWGPTMTSSE